MKIITDFQFYVFFLTPSIIFVVIVLVDLVVSIYNDIIKPYRKR